MACSASRRPRWRWYAHCRERIAALQCDLERPRGPSETDLIRGRIAELRLLIDSIEPPGPHPAATVSPPPPYSL